MIISIGDFSNPETIWTLFITLEVSVSNLDKNGFSLYFFLGKQSSCFCFPQIFPGSSTVSWARRNKWEGHFICLSKESMEYSNDDSASRSQIRDLSSTAEMHLSLTCIAVERESQKCAPSILHSRFHGCRKTNLVLSIRIGLLAAIPWKELAQLGPINNYRKLAL